MNRPTLSPIARVITFAMLTVVALSASPPSRSIPVARMRRFGSRSSRITTRSKQEFDYDVENFVKYGVLADAFYKQYGANSMNITSYYEATPAGQDSRFGFEIGAGDGVCAVKAPDDVLSKLMTATAAASTANSLRRHWEPSVQHRLHERPVELHRGRCCRHRRVPA